MAITASTPRASSHRASAVVVAEEITLAPEALTRSSSAGSGRPKWKLTTSGRSASTRAQKLSSKGVRPPIGGAWAGSRPSST